VPTNTKFIKRILGNQTFRDGKYSTNFIQDESAQLFEQQREPSMQRKSNISAAQTYLETLKFRAAREHNVDPWDLRDQFRLNHMAKKKLILVNKQGKEEVTYVEYLAEDKFNVYMDDPTGEFLSPLAMNVEAIHNPLSPDEILLVDD